MSARLGFAATVASMALTGSSSAISVSSINNWPLASTCSKPAAMGGRLHHNRSFPSVTS